MTLNKALFTSQRQNWETPKELLEVLRLEFDFDCDPCFLETGNVHIADMLGSDWKGKTIFVNPPYKYLRDWTKKCLKEHLKGKTVVMLIPARTDTIAFHDLILPYASEIRFIKGRLKFSGYNNSAPFPSMLVIFLSKNFKEAQTTLSF